MPYWTGELVIFRWRILWLEKQTCRHKLNGRRLRWNKLHENKLEGCDLIKRAGVRILGWYLSTMA